jgi:uncharacterized membrane protein YcaP (DUF421 family)
MNVIRYFFSEPEPLNHWQMSVRAFVIFFLAIAFLRISGRRSFGVSMPLDVVIVLILGGMLSRAITGASPFIPCLAASLVLALLHRLTGLLAAVSKGFEGFAKGEEKVVYENGSYNEKNMLRCLVSKHDLLEGVRKCTHSESLDGVKKIYIERDGDMSIITKNNNNE